MYKRGKQFAGRLTAFVLSMFIMLSLLVPVNVYAEEETTITVQDKIDLMLEKLGATNGNTAYFTINRKACSKYRKLGHGCNNCYNGSIVQTAWFKELFGTVNVSQFPTHNVSGTRRNNLGYSCFGFACFAQWYVFADTSTEKVVGERVATIKFNKKNVQSKVQPGDVIRVNGHSFMVYSIENDGLTIVDCNWNMGNQLNCVVQKHFIKYENSSCAGYTAYVNRVKKIPSIAPGMAGKFDVGSNVVTPDESVGENEDVQNKKIYGTMDLSETPLTDYRVGLDVEMGPERPYVLEHGAKLEILEMCINSKGEEIYHVYSNDLERECFLPEYFVQLYDPLVDVPITIVTGWVQETDGKWYFRDHDSGDIVTGWICSDALLWYYMDLDMGHMITSTWICDRDSSRWYYMGDSGAMCTGWIFLDDKWYYLDSKGAMCTGWICLEGTWYYLGGDGSMQTGWQTIGGKEYYMLENGACLIDTVTPDGFKVDGSGAKINEVTE